MAELIVWSDQEEMQRLVESDYPTAIAQSLGVTLTNLKAYCGKFKINIQLRISFSRWEIGVAFRCLQKYWIDPLFLLALFLLEEQAKDFARRKSESRSNLDTEWKLPPNAGSYFRDKERTNDPVVVPEARLASLIDPEDDSETLEVGADTEELMIDKGEQGDPWVLLVLGSLFTGFVVLVVLRKRA